jgi:hypothetical protein
VLNCKWRGKEGEKEDLSFGRCKQLLLTPQPRCFPGPLPPCFATKSPVLAHCDDTSSPFSNNQLSLILQPFEFFESRIVLEVYDIITDRSIYTLFGRFFSRILQRPRPARRSQSSRRLSHRMSRAATAQSANLLSHKLSR